MAKKKITAFDEAMKPYVDAATKVPSGSGSRRAKNAESAGTYKDLATIRGWDRKNGIEVSDRGRIAASVIR